MLSIAISPENIFSEESAWIQQLLNSGIERVHIRHPHASAQKISNLLHVLPHNMWGRLSFHDFHVLYREFPGIGLHTNSRNPHFPAGFKGTRSYSCHTLNEAVTCQFNSDYVTLSPFFPSVSKPGYGSDYSLLHEIKQTANTNLARIVALGGITPDKIDWLRRRGYGGFAMLGYLNNCNGQTLERRLKRIRIEQDYRYRLQFITNRPDIEGTVNSAVDAVKSGCRWIQIRMKKTTSEDIEKALRAVVSECAGFSPVVIVDDHVELAKLDFVDGVHLGQTDMPVEDARNILGSEKIIGLTINTLEQAQQSPFADYYGVGPWNHTGTKENPAPVLSATGTREIIDTLRSKHIFSPVVSIGGITAEDVLKAVLAGASGVAVSATIEKALYKSTVIEEFLQNILQSYNI